MAFFVILSTFFFILSFIPLLLRFRRIKKLNLPPGPTKLPIIGNLHQFGNLPHRSLHKLSQKHGPLMYLKLGTVPTIVASSADTAREFLKTHDLECCSRPQLTSLNKLSYSSNDIAFAPYGDQWRDLRKVFTSHLFSSKKVISFRPIREEEVDRMIDSISHQNSEVNLSTQLMSLANNITCRTALGKRYYGGGGSDLQRILNETQAMFMGFFFADYVRILGFLDKFTGMRGRLEKNFKELDGFYQKVIDEHKESMRREDERDEDAVDAIVNWYKGEFVLFISDLHVP